MAKLAKSYHNFIFPFIWQHFEGKDNLEGKNKGPSFDDIKKNIEKSHAWANDDLENWHEIQLNEKEIQADEMNVNHLKYATYQYCQPAIRNAIFGKWNEDNKLEVVQSYYFTPIKNGDGIDDKGAEYVICKEIEVGKNEYCSKKYSLKLTDIKLRLYNTGVGLLCFVCENWDNPDLADIKMINDYGRRITLPYIPKSNDRQDLAYFVCADSISIYWDGMSGDICHNFREQITNINSSKKKADLNHVADFIINILNYSIGDDNKSLKKFTTNKRDRDKVWLIQPALDDRMFVMCCVNNDFQRVFLNGEWVTALDYLNRLQNNTLNDSGEKLHKYEYEKIEKSLYEFIFCDPPGGCTCQFSAMRQQLLREHLYYRWADFGSIYSVAAQAFMCITEPAHIINYFRTEYYEMACLVLVQRASLRVMQNKASFLSSDFDKDEYDVDKDKRKQIANLQEKLIAFQNQINLYEISSQEQAIELYDMMREVFLVNKHASILQEQLDGLYNIANIHQNEAFSQLAVTIAVIALIIAFPSFINDFAFFPDEWHIGTEEYYEKYSGYILFWKAGLVFAILVYIIGRKIYKNWKKKERRKI